MRYHSGVGASGMHGEQAYQPGLESPLAMAGKSARHHQHQLNQQQQGGAVMPPPLPVPRESGVAPFTVPVQPYTPASRAQLRAAIPFTPPTPMPFKGGGTAPPMYYHPTFAMNGQPMIHGTPDGAAAAAAAAAAASGITYTPGHPPPGHGHGTPTGHSMTPVRVGGDAAANQALMGTPAGQAVSGYVLSPMAHSPVTQLSYPAAATPGVMPTQHTVPIPGEDGNVFGGYAYNAYQA